MSLSIRTLLPALILLLAGCNSDVALRVAPEPDPVEGVGGSNGGPGSRGHGGGWPGLPPLPSGPWGQLDPGELPDIYFVVAHGNPGCCWDCDGDVMTGDTDGIYHEDEDAEAGDGLPPIDNDSDSEVAWDCQVEYAIIDLFGQVVAEFKLPGQDEDQYAWWSHVRIIPSGPGRFLATASGWTEAPYTSDGDEPPPEDGPIDEEDDDGYPDNPEPGAWVPWSAWEIDAVNGSVVPVAWQDGNTREIVMVDTGRRVDIGPAWAGVQVAVWPDDPEWLMLWGMEYDCSTPLSPLRAVNRLDTGMLDRVWFADDLLPPALLDIDAPLAAFAFEPSIDDDGKASFMLGVSDYGCGGGFAPVSALVNWTPSDGPRWHTETSWSGYGSRVTFAGWGGGGALQVDSPYEPSTWRMYRGEEGTVEGLVSEMAWGVRAGPVLDPAGPSFALLGYPSDSTTYGDAIHFIHGGEKVWEINELRFGLQSRPVGIFDMIVLPPWEEPQ